MPPMSRFSGLFLDKGQLIVSNHPMSIARKGTNAEYDVMCDDDSLWVPAYVGKSW